MIKKILIGCANFVYLFFKLLPSKKCVTMISRQSNEISTDFKLLKEEIEKKYSDVKVKVLCHKLEGGEKASIVEKIKYIFHCFKQMYCIATSKVVVLDTYCILISILKHKKNLTIIQMWHSMGTMKKFGYQILGMEEGTSRKTAEAMKMHQNYDYVFASSNAYAPYLAEGFGCNLDIVKIYPLPRVDLLTSKEYKENIQKSIIQKYPQIKEKKNILYCPTFRKDEKNISERIEQLIKSVDSDKYNLILKLHPLSKVDVHYDNVIDDKAFSSFDMMFIADYMISDYSCIIYEAAVLNIPLYFWAFDLDNYVNCRGLNLDYKNDVPGTVSENIVNIIKDIEKDDYDYKRLEEFRKKYICKTENCTKDIVEFIMDHMK